MHIYYVVEIEGVVLALLLIKLDILVNWKHSRPHLNQLESKGWKAHLNQLGREGVEGTLKPAGEREGVGGTLKPAGERRGGRHT